MASTLYLTAQEKKVFDGLSEKLQNGWKVERETVTFQDTPEKFQMRLALSRLRDPTLMALREKSQKTSSVNEVVALIEATTLSDVDEADLAQLFFALGPTVMSGHILAILKGAKSDNDLADVAALTFIRHELLSSLVSA